jgi:MFS family permease
MWCKLPRKLKVLLLSMIMANLGGRMYRPFVALYILSKGGTVTDVGIFYTVDTVVAAILRPIGGWFSDSIGRLQAVGIGTLFGMAGMLGLALAPTWEWLLVAEIILAFGRAVVGPSFRAFIAEAAPPGNLAQTFGLVNGTFKVVDVLGPALGGWMAAYYGLPSVFWGAVVCMVAATVFRVVVALRQPYHWEKVRLQGLKSSISGLFLGLVGGGLLTWLLVTDSLRDVGVNLYESFRPVLMQSMGLTEDRIGLLFSLSAVVYLLTNLFASRLADRWSPFGMLALGGLIEACGIGLLVYFPSADTFPLFLAITGLGLGLGDPAFDTLLARSAPKGQMGLTFGMFRMATSFLAIPSPYLGGLLWEYTTPLTPFWLGALFILSAALLTWLVMRPKAAPAPQATIPAPDS